VIAVFNSASEKNCRSRNAPNRRRSAIGTTFPLNGRKIELISRRQYWGEDRIVYLDRAGRLRWIDCFGLDGS
jgi:hypothetical protein